MSSILAFRWDAPATLRYLPNDTELALGMTLLELNWILQVCCVRRDDVGGVNWGSITTTRVTKMHNIVKMLQNGPESAAEILWSESPWLEEELEEAWTNF